MKKRWIGLLDCNNFFVSCERLFRPDLENKPVVVLSSNDGCVVARSKEIKDMGIPMGVPYFKIKDMLKSCCAATFSSHFALYRDVSRRVFEVMKSELGRIEQYSIDEAFFEITEPDINLLSVLKTRVEKEVGIPVSLGLAATKTRAKYASKLAKNKDGVCFLGEDDWSLLATSIRLCDLWGVGKSLEMKLRANELLTAADLMTAAQDRVAAIFGLAGQRIQLELLGHSAFPVSDVSCTQKSIMSSRSFRKVTTDMAVLADALSYHVRHLAAELRANNQFASVVRVYLGPSRYGDYILRGGAQEACLPSPSNDSILLLKTAHELLIKLREVDVPYQKIGVTMTGLQVGGDVKMSLFEDKKNESPTTKLMKSIDAINDCAGKELVFLGSRLVTEKWQSRAETRSPAYTTEWTALAEVKA